MASQTEGIQRLLQAEKAAAEKVGDARKEKAKRLKQAKEEAVAEIEAYRSAQENIFLNYQHEHMGSRDDLAQKIETETQVVMKDTDEKVKAHQDAVIQRLLGIVYDIKLELHQNYGYADAAIKN